jgi:hypothetical protein
MASQGASQTQDEFKEDFNFKYDFDEFNTQNSQQEDYDFSFKDSAGGGASQLEEVGQPPAVVADALAPEPEQLNVRARPRRLSVSILVFPAVNRFCMALLYGRAGRLTAKTGGFRPGQWSDQPPDTDRGDDAAFRDSVRLPLARALWPAQPQGNRVPPSRQFSARAMCDEEDDWILFRTLTHDGTTNFN